MRAVLHAMPAFMRASMATMLQYRGEIVLWAGIALIASEVLFAGLIGVTLAGDRARPGLGWLAVAGVLLVLLGALDLARFSAELEGAVDEAS